MNLEDIRRRVETLSTSNEYSQQARGELAFQQYSSVLSIMVALYGEGSSQLKSFIRDKDALFAQYGARAIEHMSHLAIGTLRNIQAEVDAGFIGNLEQTISGEVLTDFVALSREVLDRDKTDESTNVASVLAAAAFEDTLRRLAKNNNVAHIKNLSDLLNELKNQKVLEGTQVGITNSYLNFRNSAMHAEWQRIDRASVLSVLGFVEQLILDNF